MSSIPSSAMPHAYANDDENRRDWRQRGEAAIRSKGVLIGGAAAVAFLLYRLVR